MNADAHFMIGKTHSVCQDYAEAGPFTAERKLTGNARIIVSDGCSSAAQSDFGARFLVNAAKKVLDSCNDRDVDEYVGRVTDRSIVAADGYRRAMGLPVECLCATFLSAQISNGAIRTAICGDGVVAVREKETGIIHIEKYEYPSGAPYYLRYTLDSSHLDYVSKFGFKLRQSGYTMTPDGKVEKVMERDEDKEEEAMVGSLYDADYYDMIVLFTDGVHSFVVPEVTPTSKMDKRIDFLDVVRELLQFKSYTGIFAERRMKRAFDPMLGYFGKRGWVNMDDLSMGVIVQ